MAHTNTAFSYTKLFFFQLTAFKINKSRDAPEHLATENFWPKMAQKCIFGFQPNDLYYQNKTAKTGRYVDVGKNRGQRRLVWGANMSTVWKYFNMRMTQG